MIPLLQNSAGSPPPASPAHTSAPSSHPALQGGAEPSAHRRRSEQIHHRKNLTQMEVEEFNGGRPSDLLATRNVGK